ncbi:unnamed protein product [Prorocentrum cordatum]|uniref:EamA domain-containing protein n=1 Tax=Prorocentrum cordatum TaxID=2364126 RepID=A0ABN9PLA0_9DINO|nr:unnamed protein product [Polarella glacialis]
MHGVRGSLLALGIGLWCVGLQLLPFASAVVVNNTMPFFKMLFAKVLLGEKVGKERWLASLGGFIGCLIVVWCALIETRASKPSEPVKDDVAEEAVA